jgi:protein-S-isoprenylcysteine O-methyltransferase Ste14
MRTRSREIVRFFVMVVVVLGAYLVAGRADWWEMHLFLGSYMLAIVVWVVYLKVKAPDLLEERLTASEKSYGWDRVIVTTYGALLLVFMYTAALDAGRLRLSSVPLALKLVSFPVILWSLAFSQWAGMANRYLSSHVRIQKDRGHTVVQHGPYRYVRHPMYTSLVVSFPFVAFFLGSYYALIPAALIIILFTVRTYLEDMTLQEELDGYREYSQKTRYRLIPFVW